METPSAESKSFLNIFGQLIIDPTNAFNLIVEKNENIPQTIILGLYGLLNAITPILLNQSIDGSRIFELIFKGGMGAALGWFLIWLMSQLANVTNHLLGTDTEFDDVFYVFSFSFLPMILIMLIIIILRFSFGQLANILSPVLYLLGCIWTIILLFIGNRYLSKAPWYKNSISIIIPVLLIVLINYALISLRS